MKILLAAATALMALAAPLHAAQPALDEITLDAVRTCMSIVEGRPPADAAVIFGFVAAGAGFARETDQGKVEILPPAADRRSCRTHVSALTLDNEAMLAAMANFLTKPPQPFAPMQSRIGEVLGSYGSRTSIWAAKLQPTGVALVTLYEILPPNEYYHGPKLIIDYVVNRH